MKRSRERGFTLIEIMVVVVIIGILAALVITQIGGKADEAKAKTTRAMIKQLAQQVEMFKLDQNRYPEKLLDLLYQPSYVDPAKWKQPYITERPFDSWGNEFLYRVPGTSFAYDIVSLGADGKESGQGYDEDIWNHEAYKR